jgi:hypothetical protein
MTLAGGLTRFSAANVSVMLCATVNPVTMSSSRLRVSSQQEQAD